MNHARDGIPELHFIIANAVPAHYRTASFHHLRQATGQDPLQNCQVTLLRKADHGQRAQRPTTHGIHVAQRVDCGDLAESVRIVNDRGEEIYGLNEGELIGNFVHAGVIGFVKADQHVRVMLPG